MSAGPRIAIICAIPPERNTGMVSVDLAAHAFLKRANLQGALYVIGDPADTPYKRGEVPYVYRDLRTHRDEALNADAIVFWGDFLHARSYWLNDRGHWATNADPDGLNASNVLDRARLEMETNAFLADASTETLQRVITFGGTIITNSAEDECDERYRAAFERFFTHVGEALMRDAFSATKLAPLRAERPTLGCDCALLLRDADLAELSGFEIAQPKSGVGVFFGRTEGKLAMSRFAGRIAQSLGERARWIPWFWTSRRMRAPAMLCGIDFDTHKQALSPGELLSALASCRYVVTDTYHVFVNAWRMGIPSICVGRAALGERTSLSDKKKETFAEMYGAGAYYVFAESLEREPLSIQVRHAHAALTNGPMALRAAHNVSAHAALAETRLIHALKGVLARKTSARAFGAGT